MQTNAISNMFAVVSITYPAVLENPKYLYPYKPIAKNIYATTSVSTKTISMIFARLMIYKILIVFSS